VPISKECAVEICRTLVATALCGGSVLAKAVSPIASVETALGAAALIASLGHERAQHIENIVERMARQAVKDSDTWISARGPGARGRREDAIPAVQRVLSAIEPTGRELAALSFNRERIVAFYLGRASKLDGGAVFADAPGNEVARELLGDVVGYTFEAIRASPEMQSHALEELLGRTERLADETAQKVLAGLNAQFLQHAERRGLERAAIIALARRIKPGETLDYERAVRELENMVEIALDLIAQGERGTNIDAFVAAILKQVAQRTKDEELDGAVADVDGALAELARRDAEQRERQLRANETLIETAIKLEILRRDAQAVARRIEALAGLRTPRGPATLSAEFREFHDRYYKEGEQKGINFSLEIAAALAAATLRDSATDSQRGDARNLLGNALATLGERESGTARLEEAVAAYRAALKEYTRERVPLQWATTQNNLGTALGTLGEREGGTTRLEEAVSAFREALKECTRERVPLDWAMTQNNLGNALQTLGERAGGEQGLKFLEDAAAAFRAALEVYTRKDMPAQWAFTTENLAIAEMSFAEITRDPQTMRSAVSRMNEVIPVFIAMKATYNIEKAKRNLARMEELLAALS